MEDFKLNEEVRKLPCDHHFHTDCIVPWLKMVSMLVCVDSTDADQTDQGLHCLQFRLILSVVRKVKSKQ